MRRSYRGRVMDRQPNRRGRHLAVYRREGDSHVIEIKLREARQLFNTLDPSPFHEKDLDPAAEDYIVSAVREIGARRSKLIIHLPQEPAGREDRDALPVAIRNYFVYRSQHTREQLRLMLVRGFISLAIGTVFLFSCLWLREISAGLAPPFIAAILPEGLLILGWVAMWRPVEIFLYDWWPVLGQGRIFMRLASMPIEMRVTTSGADVPSN